MLNKRTQILFDQDMWQRLTSLAKAKNTSVGKLVREAVEQKYLYAVDLQKRHKAIEATLRHRPNPFKGRIDYKALINAGRKY